MKKINFLNYFNNFFPINLAEILATAFLLFGLYLASLLSYEIFHSLVEIFTVIVAFGIFIIAWNARNFLDNHFLLFLSIAYIFIAFIDVAHTFAYKGAGILDFFDPTSNLATQFWIAARYLQAFSLLLAPLFLTRKINARLVCEIFFLIVLSVFVSIFYLRIFPTAFIEGVGLTPFKIWSEYIISFMLAGSAILLFKRKEAMDRKVFYLIFYSIIFTIASELSFTTYVGVFDFSNMLGHLFKLISFLLIYKTIMEIGLKNPLSYIFRSMEQNAEVLRTSELKFRTLIKLAIDPIVLTDHRGIIILCNDATEEVFGWKEKEMTHKPFIDVFLLKEKDKIDLLDFINKKEEKIHYERYQLLGIRKNNEKFTLELSSSHWKIEDEAFFGFLMRDVSLREKKDMEILEKSKELEKLVNDLKIVQLSMDNAFAHVVITDENGSILYANKAAEEMTGFSKKEMLNKKPSLWGKQMSLPFYKNFWKIIKEDKENFNGEIINKRKNGELYEAEIRVSPVLDDKGEVKFFVALERDITQEKEINKAKSEFLSLAAHQLRTPLTTISLTTEILLRDIAGSMPQEGKKYLKSIFAEIKGMTEMITMFLNISRVELGKFPIEMKPVKLFEIIEKTVEEVLPQIKDKKINLKRNYKKNLPVVNLDTRIMRIILENFLSNAIKYSHKNGKILLEVRETNDLITIEVTDSGIGIPKKDQSKIFTKMFRAENVSKIKSNGSGLGLYLAKGLAEQSGYNISFKSKENEGATFTVTISRKNILDKTF